MMVVLLLMMMMAMMTIHYFLLQITESGQKFIVISDNTVISSVAVIDFMTDLFFYNMCISFLLGASEFYYE